jgi:hypothetical protein
MYYNYKSSSEYNSNGINIFNEDWDNLIILDACRYDYFKELNDIDGELESRISRGSQSSEFIRGNFQGQKANDTVYLSDNPWYAKLEDSLDAELCDFSFCERDAFDGTVSYPSTVTESAIEYAKEYPNKRLIVHYLQPHAPYFNVDGTEKYRWPSKNRNDCDPQILQEAYRDNVKVAISEAKKLSEKLEGKTVITADHGELLGERLLPIPLRQFQHPPGIYNDELVKVPWFITEYEERKEINSESSSQKSNIPRRDEDEIENQLEALGYR